jgi:hypothetical protein
MFAIVPNKAFVNGASGDNLRTGQVSRYSDTEVMVRFEPGPQPSGAYAVLLMWEEDDTGPVQVRGPNLAASFPNVTLTNQSPPAPERASSVPKPPEPRVTVRRQLVPGGDYTFLGGLPPDQLVGAAWVWKPETGYLSAAPVSSWLDVEAHSATADEQSHAAEFRSGIAFGIAASALIAAMQEFLNSARQD